MNEQLSGVASFKHC